MCGSRMLRSAREANRDGTLGAICWRNARADVLVVSGAVRAEPMFSFDATPGKLPKTVVPINYSIELRPDAESRALPGAEVIDIEVREPTARLTLNAVNTTFASVTADDVLDAWIKVRK
jgi:hypothetical protein